MLSIYGKLKQVDKLSNRKTFKNQKDKILDSLIRISFVSGAWN